MKSSKAKAIWGLIGIVLIFVGVSYLVRVNLDFFESLIGNSWWGLTIYFLIVVAAIIVAPISMEPLIPLASNLWGWEISFLLNISGWWIGSMAAFLIARRWGSPLVKKIFSLEQLHKIEKKIPRENLFFGIILLRMAIPVDILSYALGLFTNVKFRTYSIATLIGMTPLALFLSYLGSVPPIYQIAGIIAIVIFVAIMYVILWKKGIIKD